MNKKKHVEQQKIMATSIFTISMLAFGKGVSNSTTDLSVLTVSMLIFGGAGAALAVYAFVKAK